jgi:lipoprotein-anchoring transpeptidase ErfK/SrfK
MQFWSRAAFCVVAAMAWTPVAQAEESAAEFFSAAFNQTARTNSFRLQQGGVARDVVAYPGRHAPGTVVVSTSERRLYFVLPDGRAVRYGVGVGRPGFQWGGQMSITRKAEWPDWRPPAQMLKRRPDLPRFMKGGPENPLGARALYLGSSLYRIHGSNEPETIGQAVSSGCIRMTNADVTDLYSRVRVGTRVVVMR